MKSYACYPKTRVAYGRPYGGFVNPYFPHFTNEVNKSNPVANRPAANIVREDHAYKIQLAVPGLSKEQIKIELNEDQLIITGPVAGEQSKPKFIREEFDYVGFKRTFRLHQHADTAAMTAGFEQGILTITIPDKNLVTTKINIQ
jgi:HSP20 family protein